MHRISIAMLSPRILGKMRRGGKVRVCAGDGFQLIVNPANYNHITKTFNRGKGLHLQLSPEELHHNHAEGIFGRVGDKALAGLNKLTGHDVGAAAYKLGDYLKPMAKNAINSAISAGSEALMASNPEYGSLIKLGTPLVSHMAGAYMDKPSSFGVGNEPPSRVPQNATLAKANLGTARANSANAALTRGSREGGRGLLDDKFSLNDAAHFFSQDVPHMFGHGIHTPHRREVGSIGRHGNLLGYGLHPALRSQPLSANFQWGHTLPPAYQSFAKSGQGLY